MDAHKAEPVASRIKELTGSLQNNDKLTLYKRLGDYYYNSEIHDSAIAYYTEGITLAEKLDKLYEEAIFNFGLAKKVVFSLDYYRTEKIDYDPGKTAEPENLLQVDFNFKF